MTTALKPGWSKPSTILFASEFPANEKAFSLALAQTAEFDAELILFHAHDSLDLPPADTSAMRLYEYAAARAERRRLEPLVDRAKALGVRCKTVVRPGPAGDEILAFLHERRIDRVIMGTHTSGRTGKVLVGSVAEAVLSAANVPVCIVGPNVDQDTSTSSDARKILCDVSRQETQGVLANFCAEMASRQNASLILQRVIPPQRRAELLAGRTIEQVEAELPPLVSPRLKRNLKVRSKVLVGDPAEELLVRSRAEQADLIVLGAQPASHFALVRRAATDYKVLAYAHCPVVTLSPALLAGCGVPEEARHPTENYLAGVF